MKTKFTLPAKEFSFAGFDFPKNVFTLPSGNMEQRIARMKQRFTGPYYHAPKPNNSDGVGFYLADVGMPATRWQWADEVEDVRIGHTGWFCDTHQDCKIRGIVFRLPNNRGFLAGCSMGEHMSSNIDGKLYDSATDAARAADGIAEWQAEREREYQEAIEQEDNEGGE